MATTYRIRSTMSLKSYNVSMKYTINSQKISTRLLTVLIICVILHAEQRKREKIKGSQGVLKIGKSSEVLSDR